jgi:uncharacterized protein (TIGR04255 family)
MVMMKLPMNITPCPINEAVFEIRYQPGVPADAVFGILYSLVGKYFKDAPVGLPILQLPEAIRIQNPDLAYQPYHRLGNGNLILSVGPKVLTFSNIKPYIGWGKWSSFFESVLADIQTSNVIKHVERTGLRYINIFENQILDSIELQIKLKDKVIKDESTTFRSEIIDSGIIKILQIGSSVSISTEGKSKVGSLIDIDCVTNLNESADRFFEHYREVIDLAHKKEKELFYDLLKPAFLQTLKPTYGEEK